MHKRCWNRQTNISDLSATFERALEHLCGLYSEKPPQSKHPVLAELSKIYGLQIISEDADYSMHHANSSSYHISYEAPTDEQTSATAELLKSELSLYSAETIRRSKIERIILTSRLNLNGNRIGGIAEVGWFVVDSLLLNTDFMSPPVYGRQSIHHELYHAIDYRDDLNHWHDSTWMTLNRSDFIYKGRSDPPASIVPASARGFVSEYAMTDVREDKAEVYSHLIMNYAVLQDRARTDRVLSAKIDRMKQMLEKFSPHFDSDFWNRVEKRSQVKQ